MDIFYDPDLLVKVGFSKGVDNFPDIDLATLLKAKNGKAVVPHQATEVAYALSFRLSDSSHRDNKVARLKAALASTEKEREEALSKRDELSDLCLKQRLELESLLAHTREASEVYKREMERLKKTN
ncbi:hypothetical protein LIER_37471 [Lithospermum erythrorhizon]|uniref:Uncharacterized protein n=1 Tax=Lithospermum erythrorhizon TaxID=34254 RepID=A0AAV3PKV3_LITER